jgi:hypothetical protein
VERETIDFVDPTLNIWNQEVLCSSGLVCRILFETEMDYFGPALLSDDVLKVSAAKNNIYHLLKAFSFTNSTPHNLISRILKDQFYNGSKYQVKIPSTKGLLMANVVFLPNEVFPIEMKNIPIVDPDAMKFDPNFFERLLPVMRRVGLPEMLAEIAQNEYDDQNSIKIIKWWIAYRKSNRISEQDLYDFLNSFKINGVRMSKYRYYSYIIPVDMPVSTDTIPPKYMRNISKFEIQNFFG